MVKESETLRLETELNLGCSHEPNVAKEAGTTFDYEL